MNYLLITIPLLVFSSCSSTYYKGKPQMNLTGEAAKQEVDQFTMWPKSVLSPGLSLQVGPRKKNYSYSSLRDGLLDFSPKIKPVTNKIDKWQERKIITLIASSALYIYSSVIPDDKKRQLFASVAKIGFLGGLGIHVYQLNLIRKIPKNFNDDLESKVTPGIFWERNF